MNTPEPGGSLHNAFRSATRSVTLVARRELRTKLRNRAFLLGTVAIIAAIGGFILLQMTLLAGAGTSTVALAGQATHISAELERNAEQLGLTVETTTIDGDEARTAVEAGDVDAVVEGSPSEFHVLVESDLNERLELALSAITQQQVMTAALAQAGVDNPAAVMAQASEADVDVTALSGTTPEDNQRLIVGAIMAFLLFFSITTYGAYVAQGVVEEKSSRVVEILLSTIRPWQLLLGKVAGLGLVGLSQLVIIGGAGLVLATATGVLEVTGVAVGTLAWGVLWYLLGFFLYATIYAAAASLVSRQEDLQSVLTPVTIILVGGFVAGFNVMLHDPGSTAAVVLSLVPLLAPILLPGRIAAGDIAAWEIGTAIGLTLLAVAALTWLGSTVYRNAILHMGSRIKLTAALRQART
ncbi:ABC transporter permease [Haloechinothrix sp. LS1_15]|uniref:ABC transporter permease n=1 Tax=Haloechinothrix sp. LS1_15 TaxID=2652248 RepID=UPI00294446F3|nr:ABC transporter permease [Haloechinothrix sp. LS1_15]MDV6014337.1 ABC transporter permease [Haloechinothrix sp. LS1_15]